MNRKTVNLLIATAIASCIVSSAEFPEWIRKITEEQHKLMAEEFHKSTEMEKRFNEEATLLELDTAKEHVFYALCMITRSEILQKREKDYDAIESLETTPSLTDDEKFKIAYLKAEHMMETMVIQYAWNKRCRLILEVEYSFGDLEEAIGESNSKDRDYQRILAAYNDQ